MLDPGFPVLLWFQLALQLLSSQSFTLLTNTEQHSMPKYFDQTQLNLKEKYNKIEDNDNVISWNKAICRTLLASDGVWAHDREACMVRDNNTNH